MGLYFIFQVSSLQEGGWFSRQGVDIMAVKVFLIGRPGSGKSTAAHHITKQAHRQECPTTHIYDYKILYNWFMAEMNNPRNKHKNFLPRGYGGFDVINFSVLRKALEEVERRARMYMSFKRRLILIEFARDDYSEVLRTFSYDFLQDAYFLFLDADIETCIERVRERSLHPTTEYDHFVSTEIITSYYDKDNKPYMLSQFAQEYHLDNERVAVIDNTGSRNDFLQQIKAFTNALFERDRNLSDKTGPLLEASLKQKKAYRITEPLLSPCSSSILDPSKAPEQDIILTHLQSTLLL
jgi:adenylate kinase family enzyme